MGGALQAVSSFISAIKPAENVLGVGAMISAVEGIESAAGKLMDAAKTANPAEKANIDQKLGELQQEATKDLANAKGLIDNAAAKGDPGALAAEMSIKKLEELIELHELLKTLKKINESLGKDPEDSRTAKVHQQIEKAWADAKSPSIC